MSKNKKKKAVGRPRSAQPLTRFYGSVEKRHADAFHARRKARKTTVRVVFGEMVEGAE